jgi:hypothetical protein
MTDMTNAEFIRDLAARMFRNATPAMGFDQGDTDRLYVIANRLAAIEQDGEPVAGIGHGEEADYAELKRLYNFSDDDSLQFTRWNMLIAIRHGKRLGQEFDGELPLKFDPRDAKRWWEENMKESKFVSARLAGDGYVKFHWRDADESGDYSVPWTRIALWLATLSSAKRGEKG